jgi:hypothetical protein
MLLSQWAMSRPLTDMQVGGAIGGLALFVLGGYLALAGHRSHLYQSHNELTTYLVREIRRSQEKG